MSKRKTESIYELQSFNGNPLLSINLWVLERSTIRHISWWVTAFYIIATSSDNVVLAPEWD
jgi:hypothetical protein